MQNFNQYLFSAALGLISAGTLPAQEAAGPRRGSPTPAEQAASPQPAQTPAPTPEASTPTPEPTAPASTPTPEQAVTPAAEQTPAPTPQKQPSPAARVKREKTRSSPARGRGLINEKPVRALEPRPRRPWDESFVPATPSRPTFDLSRRGSGSVSSTLRGLKNRWQTAIMNGDAKTIAELAADDFVGTSATGRIPSKSALLAAVRKDKNVYKSVKARGMSVRSLGPGVAVITGIASRTGTTPDGKPLRTSIRFTDTWRSRGGRWQCVASRATEIPKT